MPYNDRELQIVKERVLKATKPSPLPPEDWARLTQQEQIDRYSNDADWACLKIFEYLEENLEEGQKLDEGGMYNALRSELVEQALSGNQMSWALNTARAFVGLEPIDPMSLFADA